MSQHPHLRQLSMTRPTPRAADAGLLRTAVSYTVDADGVIVATGEGWAAFAEAADAHHLHPEGVVGRRLDDFLSHPTTRLVYRALSDRIHAAGRPVTFPFRCDAPDVRRWMTMEMRPLEDGGTHYRVWPETLDPRAPVPVTGGPPSGVQLVMCGWCNRVASGPTWCEIEEAMARPPLSNAGEPPLISHGMCEECESRMERLIDGVTQG